MGGVVHDLNDGAVEQEQDDDDNVHDVDGDDVSVLIAVDDNLTNEGLVDPVDNRLLSLWMFLSTARTWMMYSRLLVLTFL